jgi:lysozyme
MTFAPVNTSRVWGPDISHWDGNVNLSVTKARGASFVFIKGIDGALIVKNFVPNRQAAIDAGLPHAPYFWLYRDRDVSCTSQAMACSELVAKYPPDLPPVVDFEWTYYGGIKTYPDYTDLEKWVNKWLLLNNEKPILYSSAGYMNAIGRIPDSLKAKFAGFWFANYGALSPALPYGFDTWLFWQFTASADASYYAPNDNGKKELDVNYFNGDKNYFREYFRLGTVTEEPMSQWYRVNTAALNIRTGPGTSYPDVGDLLMNDKVETVRNVGGWLETVKIIRAANGSIETPIPSVWCKDSYCAAIPAPVEPPPVVKTPFTLSVQGYKPYSGELEKA